MQFLGGPPGAAVAVFAEVLDHRPHVFEVADPRLRVPEPKTLRVTAHQCHRALAQFRRSGRGRRKLAQFIKLGSHETKLKMTARQGKESLRPWRRAFGLL